MNASKVLAELFRADIDVRLADDGVNLTVTANPKNLTEHHRQLVLANKPEIVAFLQAVSQTTTALIEAAMRCCDHFDDGPAAREQMRADCQATPAHLQADLQQHFETTYPKAKP